MEFKIPKVKTCCCGCSLKTGSKLIAYVFVIASFFLIVLTIVDGFEYNNFSAFSSILVEFTYTAETVFSCILLYAINKENYVLILPWVLLQSVSIGRNIISLLLFLILHINGTHHEQTTFEFLELVITSYFVLVIFNYYRELKLAGSYSSPVLISQS